ncbi:MFS transporter [Mycolicibacterium brisbanense]
MTDSSAISERRERDWRLLTAVFVFTTTAGYIAMIQVLPVVLVPMALDLGVSRTAAAATSTISTLTGAVAAFPVGRLMDRRGGRMTMTAGVAVGAAAVVLWSQAHSLVVLYVAFVLIGLSITLSTYEAAFAVIVVVTEPGYRDRAILTVTMIAGLATYLVYPLLGWMNNEFGWRTTVAVLGVAYALTCVPAHAIAIPALAAHRDLLRDHSGIPIREALRQKRFWLLLVAFVGQAGSVAAFLLLVVAYLMDVGHSAVVATAMPIAVGVLQILSRLVITTVGRRWHLTSATAVAFAVQGVGLVALPFVGLSVPLTFLCVAAVGLGQGIGVIARPLLVATSFGVAHFATVLAAITVPMALARAGTPIVAAWLGDWRFLIGSGAIALAGALALIPLTADRPPRGNRSLRSAGRSSAATSMRCS